MPGRVQVKLATNLATNLVIDDRRPCARARTNGCATRGPVDDDFPDSASSDVPLDEVVHSLVAAAVPLELPGCRRSAMEVEVGEQVEESEGAPASGDQDSGDQDPGDQDPGDQDPGRS